MASHGKSRRNISMRLTSPKGRAYLTFLARRHANSRMSHAGCSGIALRQMLAAEYREKGLALPADSTEIVHD